MPSYKIPSIVTLALGLCFNACTSTDKLPKTTKSTALQRALESRDTPKVQQGTYTIGSYELGYGLTVIQQANGVQSFEAKHPQIQHFTTILPDGNIYVLNVHTAEEEHLLCNATHPETYTTVTQVHDHTTYFITVKYKYTEDKNIQISITFVSALPTE